MVMIAVCMPDGKWQHFKEKKEFNWARVYWNNGWRLEKFYHSEEEAARPFRDFQTVAIRTIMGLTIPKE